MNLETTLTGPWTSLDSTLNAPKTDPTTPPSGGSCASARLGVGSGNWRVGKRRAVRPPRQPGEGWGEGVHCVPIFPSFIFLSVIFLSLPQTSSHLPLLTPHLSRIIPRVLSRVNRYRQLS